MNQKRAEEIEAVQFNGLEDVAELSRLGDGYVVVTYYVDGSMCAVITDVEGEEYELEQGFYLVKDSSLSVLSEKEFKKTYQDTEERCQKEKARYIKVCITPKSVARNQAFLDALMVLPVELKEHDDICDAFQYSLSNL